MIICDGDPADASSLCASIQLAAVVRIVRGGPLRGDGPPCLIHPTEPSG